MSSSSLPPRRDQQSLQAYAREHLRQLEHELCFGVPYRALAKAVLAAGFAKAPVRSIENALYQARKKRGAHAPRMVLQTAAGRPFPSPTAWQADPAASEPKTDRAAIRRRLLELSRPPMPGEPDPLI